MSSSKIKQMFKLIFTTNGGCGCGKPKSSEIIEPKPKGKLASSCNTTSSSSWDKTSTTLTPSCSDQHDQFLNVPSGSSKTVNLQPKFGDSIAVVKESDDPYQDFRESIVQMILEMEIYSKDDLQELLDCFLSLNSPSHHEIIVKAFMDIWNGVAVSEKSHVSNELKKSAKSVDPHG